jgi:hypothetical protein
MLAFALSNSYRLLATRRGKHLPIHPLAAVRGADSVPAIPKAESEQAVNNLLPTGYTGAAG